VKAELVLVEILSVYCQHCQTEAPFYNKLYKRLEGDSDLKGRVKLMGVAAGNGELAIGDFKKKYGIEFPIIPDSNFELHELTGGSRTPFLIFVRKGPSAESGIVAKTHLGSYKDLDHLLEEVRSIRTADVSSFHEKGKTVEEKLVKVEPILTEKELLERVQYALHQDIDRISHFEKISLKNAEVVYAGLVKEEAEERTRLYARVVSRANPCDICHDVHFIYVFKEDGKIVNFYPLQLRKYGNRALNEEEVGKLREKIVGKYVYQPFPFDPEVDAVTSATITSSVIFDSLSKGGFIFEELKERGSLQGEKR
jgi:hypothetical protein